MDSYSIWIKRSSKIHGPFTTKQVKAGIKAGKFLPSDELAPSESGPWRTMIDLAQASSSQKPFTKTKSSTTEDNDAWVNLADSFGIAPERESPQKSSKPSHKNSKVAQPKKPIKAASAHKTSQADWGGIADQLGIKSSATALSKSTKKESWASLADSLGAATGGESPQKQKNRPLKRSKASKSKQVWPPSVNKTSQADWGGIADQLGIKSSATALPNRTKRSNHKPTQLSRPAQKERLPKKISPASMRQLIHSLRFDESTRFSVFPDIPKKKLKAASEFGATPLRPDEEILFVYETTFFGTPKKGITWTTHAIHSSGDNGKKSFMLEDIISLDVVVKDSDTGNGQLQINGTDIYNEDEFEVLVKHFSPIFANYRLKFFESDQEIKLTPEEREIYIQLATQTGDWLEEERRRMAKNTACWNSNRSLTATEVSNKIVNNELIKVGIPYPQIEDLINANLEPDEIIQFVIAGIGANTLCFTNQSIMIVNDMVDTERSNPGTAGEVKGAMAGHLVGQGIGTAVGSQFGITGMMVGGLLGSATGLLAGAEAGKVLTRNILTNVTTAVLPYSSIKQITAGQKSIDEDNACPALSFISYDSPKPVEFIFHKKLQPFTTPLLSEMKKCVAKLSKQNNTNSRNIHPNDSNNKDSLERMRVLKKMLEEGLISEKEFEEKKQVLLEQL